MKKSLFIITASIAIFSFFSFRTLNSSESPKDEYVNIYVKGTRDKNITVNLCYGQVIQDNGQCSSQCPNCSGWIYTQVGHIIYDGDTKKKIITVTSEMNEKTLDLYEYY